MQAYYKKNAPEGFYYAFEVNKAVKEMEIAAKKTIFLTPFLTFVITEMEKAITETEKAATEMVSVTPFLTFVTAETGKATTETEKAATEMISVTPFLTFSGNKSRLFAVNTPPITPFCTIIYRLLAKHSASQ